MNLGETIQKLRKSKGKKQNEFARICEITPAYLSQIENNQKDPNISILKIIAENLAVPLPILFFLSIDEKDIKPEKKHVFNTLAPSLKSLISSFFSD